MTSDIDESWYSDLNDAVRTFDWPFVTNLVRAYVRHLRGAAAPTSLPEVKAVLQLLRENLRYAELRAVADAALGQGLSDAVVRRQYAQALVDGDNPAAALLLFDNISADLSAPDTEQIEARGGVGRCYKQLFVVTTYSARRAEYLTRALTAYLQAYREDPGRFWHGINAVALLARADRDGLHVTGHEDPGATARDIAAEILDLVEALPEPDAWAKATACEALLALGRCDEVVRRGNTFVRALDVDAFKIASLLRQLLEIWELDTTDPPGDTLLPVLRSALLNYRGGGVVVETRDVRASRLAEAPNERLERVLGGDRYQSLTWYRNGLARCRAVAQILNVNEDGIGTGFLVNGSELHDALPSLVLMTNGHVVPENLPAADAVVVFHGLDADTGHRCQFRVVRRWWYEPSESPGLDTTLLELDGYPDHVEPLPLARRLPALTTESPRAYLIGHPRGLAQPQFSLQDNLLLDYDDTVVHYRSPTESGSSGSPVFDHQWKLIGLHHSGGFDTPRLNNHGG
ncbi:MAG: serine protease, partial [Actinomycetota bacterium]|nr:serine protease [Actinomycetota bacterium]